MSSWFNGILTIQTTKFLIGKESEFIFTYWCMISNSSSSSSTKRVEMAKVLELQTILGI